MFTGIIEAIADIKGNAMNNEILSIEIARPAGWDLHEGQSIAVNGVCLTVITFSNESFTVEVMPETIKRSVFGEAIPKHVNLERAMSPESLFEGHIVQGHVDELSTIIQIDESPQWRTVHVSYPRDKAGLLVEKGSVTVDGISLTIVDVSADSFSVSLIPHTISNTTLGKKSTGDKVNIEYDVLGKFVERQLQLKK